jgi:hypothetical protein
MKEIETKTIFRAFWAWNSEREERWLRRMAGNGWRLIAPRGVFYRFERAAPADVIFRLDYQSPKKTERAEYLGLFQDAGWEHAGEFGGWHYFRTPAGDGPPPEIHTDTESRVAMYRRLLGFMATICIAVWVPFFTNLRDPWRSGTFWVAVRILQGLLVVIWVYALVRIGRKIRELKQGGRRKNIKGDLPPFSKHKPNMGR